MPVRESEKIRAQQREAEDKRKHLSLSLPLFLSVSVSLCLLVSLSVSVSLSLAQVRARKRLRALSLSPPPLLSLCVFICLYLCVSLSLCKPNTCVSYADRHTQTLTGRDWRLHLMLVPVSPKGFCCNLNRGEILHLRRRASETSLNWWLLLAFRPNWIMECHHNDSQ